jgi:CheY-like chemotaxis protein
MARKKILLVVDSESLVNLENLFSNTDKFELWVTDNGREAFRIIREQQPDLALMDIGLPDLNGDECCYSLKKDNASPKTRIVLLAYMGKVENQERCQRACCDGVLMKPLIIEQVSALLYKFLFAEEIPPRFNVRIAIYYGSEQQELLSNYSVNLSTGGIFIETDKKFAIDAPLFVEFMLPSDNNRISCKARVAWINERESLIKPHLPPGIGLHFQGLMLKDVHAIRDFINKGILPLRGDLPPTRLTC